MAESSEFPGKVAFLATAKKLMEENKAANPQWYGSSGKKSTPEEFGKKVNAIQAIRNQSITAGIHAELEKPNYSPDGALDFVLERTLAHARDRFSNGRDFRDITVGITSKNDTKALENLRHELRQRVSTIKAQPNDQAANRLEIADRKLTLNGRGDQKNISTNTLEELAHTLGVLPDTIPIEDFDAFLKADPNNRPLQSNLFTADTTIPGISWNVVRNTQKGSEFHFLEFENLAISDIRSFSHPLPQIPGAK